MKTAGWKIKLKKIIAVVDATFAVANRSAGSLYTREREDDEYIYENCGVKN